MVSELFDSMEYREWLNQVKSKIRSVQIKAALEVNKSLLSLYWTLGKMIVDKQTESGWGNAVIERLSRDLKKEFPEMKGFSRANLFSTRKWYLFYSVQDKKVQQLVRQIPWGHNILIINKIKDYNKAEFYINATVANNWSRNVLLHQIETNLYDRKRHLTHNFNPSIGIILCKTRNKIIAEYALRDMSKPIGVSEYKFTEAVPEELKSSLPTIEELETGLIEDL